MNPRMLTLSGLLLLSLAAGLAIGEWFFRLYMSAIPTVALSDFNTSSSHVAYLVYGAGVGVLLFLWLLLGLAIGRAQAAIKRRAEKKAATPAA